MSAVIYPTTNLMATEQLVVDRGEGVYIYDNHGKQYLEGMSGLWCTGLGYGNRELIDAISEQLAKLSFTHMFGGKTHQPGMDLADKLAAMVPVKDAKVFFGNSGSDANPYGWSHTYVGLSRNGESAASRQIGVNRCRKGGKRETPGHRFLGVGRKLVGRSVSRPAKKLPR